MTGISRGRQYEDGPLEPWGAWKHLTVGDMAGEWLHAMLSPEARLRPPFTHTYCASPSDPSRPTLARRLLRRPVPTEAPFTHIFTRSDGEPDRAPRGYGLRSWWAARCRWRMGPHRPVGVDWLSPPPTNRQAWFNIPDQHQGVSWRQCGNCGKRL